MTKKITMKQVTYLVLPVLMLLAGCERFLDKKPLSTTLEDIPGGLAHPGSPPLGHAQLPLDSGFRQRSPGRRTPSCAAGFGAGLLPRPRLQSHQGGQYRQSRSVTIGMQPPPRPSRPLLAVQTSRAGGPPVFCRVVTPPLWSVPGSVAWSIPGGRRGRC